MNNKLSKIKELAFRNSDGNIELSEELKALIEKNKVKGCLFKIQEVYTDRHREILKQNLLKYVNNVNIKTYRCKSGIFGSEITKQIWGIRDAEMEVLPVVLKYQTQLAGINILNSKKKLLTQMRNKLIYEYLQYHSLTDINPEFFWDLQRFYNKKHREIQNILMVWKKENMKTREEYQEECKKIWKEEMLKLEEKYGA